jgi:DNA repair protein RadC
MVGWSSMTKPLLATTDTILAQVKFIRSKKQEYFICLSLDSARRLITRRTVTIGTLTSTLVHPREVFAGPLKDRAALVVVIHNHPSGEPGPSSQDIEMTQQLVAAGIILGIPLAEHIIVTRTDHYSFRKHQHIM